MTNGARSDAQLLLPAACALLLSIALHVVPQMWRDWIDPAWSMLILMIVDAGVVALIVRSRAALLVGLLLVAVLGAAWLSHQQIFAALPSVTLNLMLASVFAVTLRRGETPLIVRIAEFGAVRAIEGTVRGTDGALPPEFVRYLRALTCAWMIFFVTMAAMSLVLMLYAPFEWWSLFVNVLMWPLVALMFTAEWVVRRIGFRDLPAHGPLHIATKIFAYQRQAGAVRAEPVQRGTGAG